MRICQNKWCEIAFTGHVTKKYCSRKCSRNIQPASERLKKVRCAYDGCGKVFQQRVQINHKFCSPLCTQALYRRNSGVMSQEEVSARREKAKKSWGNRPTLSSKARSKITKACELQKTRQERIDGITMDLKIEIMEALVARGHVLTEAEYIEEITALVKPSGKSLEFLLNYAENMHYKKVEFEYGSHSYDDHNEFKSNFEGYDEPVYGVNLLQGGISLAA